MGTSFSKVVLTFAEIEPASLLAKRLEGTTIGAFIVHPLLWGASTFDTTEEEK
jgi:hypothetical protein